jgi:hypothetical protein
MLRAFRLPLLTLAVLAAACGRDAPTPTAPTPPPPIAGQWQGSFVITECPGAPNCGFVSQTAPPSDAWKLELTLSPPDGTTIEGTLVPHIWGPFPRAVPVSGEFVNGRLSLTGRTSWDATGACFSGYPAGEFVLRELGASLDLRTGTIDGGLTFQTYKALTSCYFAPAMVVVSRTMTLWARE